MNKRLMVAIIILVAAALIYGLHRTYQQPLPAPETNVSQQRQSDRYGSHDIRVLTRQQRVIDYLHQHQRLPDFYITKSLARKQGWEPSRGNLCQVLPGRAIGGDSFGNREKRLPEQNGRRWFEADINYACGRRGSDRLLYSNDGLIYLTDDHYRNFTQAEK